MNTLKVSMVSTLHSHICTMLDGTPIKLKRNRSGLYEGLYTTEKDNIELSVYKYLEIKSKLWLLMSLVFFVVSLFGLISPRYDKRCIVLEYKVNIKLKENTEVKLSANRFVDKGRAFEITTDADAKEIKNIAYVDKLAKKRLRILRAIEVVLWIALIIVLIALLAK